MTARLVVQMVFVREATRDLMLVQFGEWCDARWPLDVAVMNGLRARKAVEAAAEGYRIATVEEASEYLSIWDRTHTEPRFEDIVGKVPA